MNPKKGKEFIPEVALGLGLPEEQVDKIITSFYKYVRKNLVNMEYITINLDKLGTFYVKERKTMFKLDDYQEMSLRLVRRKEGPWKEAVVRNLEVQIERYQRAMAFCGERENEKKEFWIKKQKYRDEKNKTKTDSDMAK